MFKRAKILLPAILSTMVGFGNPISAQEPTAPSPPPTSDRKLKVAIVDIQAVFREFHKTKAAQKQIDRKRATITAGQDRAEIDVSRLDSLREKLISPDEEAKISVTEKESARAELQSMQQQFRLKSQQGAAITTQENRQLDQQMTLRMNSILSEIQTATAAYAEANDFDLVIDSSGLTSSQAPLILFAEDALNITATILKELNKDAPPQ